MKRSLLRAFSVYTDGPDSPSDAVLLRRFSASGDEPAFELLVRRHAATVWAACQRVLRNEADADDAFQATFLSLARNAGGVKSDGTLAGWLHRVAVHAALKLRARRRKEVVLPGDMAGRSDPPTDAFDTAVIHEELAQLRDDYRTTILLVDLEGYTHADAAKLLGWPVGTVSGRLVRARAELKRRLKRRGVTVSVVALTAGVVSEPRVRAAVAVAVGRLPAPVQVDAITHEVLIMIANAKRKVVTLVAAGLIAVSVTGSFGVVTFAQPPKANPTNPDPKAGDKPAAGWNDPRQHPTLYPELAPAKNFDLGDAIRKLPETVILERDPAEIRIAKKRLQANLRVIEIIERRVRAGSGMPQVWMPLYQSCSQLTTLAKQIWTDQATLLRYAEFRLLTCKYFEGFMRPRVEVGMEQDTQLLPLLEAERYAAELELHNLKKK